MTTTDIQHKHGRIRLTTDAPDTNENARRAAIAVAAFRREVLPTHTTVAGFLAAHWQDQANQRTTFGEFYRLLGLWCERHRQPCPSKAQVSRQVKALGYRITRPRLGGERRLRCIEGLQLA